MGMKSNTIAKIAQELADAWNLPKFHKITRENLYTEINIGISWHEGFKSFVQSFVCIQMLDINNEVQLSSIRTGLLVKTGIPD
jgi:hypothetical protein